MTDMGAPRRSDQLRIVYWPEPEAERDVPMPRVRSECEGEGVCLKLSCKWNLTIDVTYGGSIRLNAVQGIMGPRKTSRSLDPDAFSDEVIAHLAGVETNCMLDVIQQNPDGMRLEDIAEILGVARQLVHQVESVALRKLKRSGGDRVLKKYLTNDDD